MIQPKQLQTSYSALIADEKAKISTLKLLAAKLANFFAPLTFIKKSQWILLVLLNIICTSFIVFVFILIR